MTATVINDNTTTSATLNFTDQYLLASTKVTSFFRKIQAPNCVDIYYAASLDRMVLTLPTEHLVSLPADPESNLWRHRRGSRRPDRWTEPCLLARIQRHAVFAERKIGLFGHAQS